VIVEKTELNNYGRRSAMLIEMAGKTFGRLTVISRAEEYATVVFAKGLV
jgi:hypothetical protein